jgi:hypothetical protein
MMARWLGVVLAATAAGLGWGFLVGGGRRAPAAPPGVSQSQRRAAVVSFTRLSPADRRPEGDPEPRPVTVNERAWNSSTMGALPSDLESLAKEVRVCA